MNENKFTGKAETYAAHRPGYPARLYAFLLEETGIGKGDAIADIGAGTGIFSIPLAEHGCKVFAVEPNPDMRRIAERELEGQTGISLVDATAEATTLPDASVRLATAAQAFHWFDPRGFAEECRRILVPGGAVAIVYNHRLEDDPVTKETLEINKKYCPRFLGFSGGVRKQEKERISALFRDGIFTTREFGHEYFLDETGFVGRALSSSYAPASGEQGFEEYTKALRKLFAEHAQNGKTRARLVCKVYLGSV